MNDTPDEAPPALSTQASPDGAASRQGEGALPLRPLYELEDVLGYKFKESRHLSTALAHKSYLHDVPDFPLGSNERLEFLGDAVLGVIVSSDLFLTHPDVPEGQLSALRGALVRLNTLAEIAEPLDLGEFMYMSRGEEAAGGRHRGSTMGRAVEAVLGAVYVDGGLDAAASVWHRIVGERGLEQLQEVLRADYKSLLQQHTQANMKETPLYRLVDATGPDHAKEFKVEVLAGERVLASGVGRNKQVAEQAAAKQALDMLKSRDDSRENKAPTRQP
jgi:ribonuclease-3